MSIEKAIFEEIKNDEELGDLLREEEGRYNLYPLEIPTDVMPTKAIKYSEVTTTETYPMAGSSVFQFTCIAGSYEDAQELARNVIRVFNNRKFWKIGGDYFVNYTKFETKTSFRNTETGNVIVPVEVFIKY